MNHNNDQHSSLPEAGIYLNGRVLANISHAGKWAVFLGILGFIFCGIFALMVLALPGRYFMRSGSVGVYTPGFAIVITKAVYLLLCTVHFFLSLYLYQFGSGVKRSISTGDAENLSIALGKMKAFFKLLGIFFIVSILLCLLLTFIPFVINILMRY